jgi:hypothetical protein
MLAAVPAAAQNIEKAPPGGAFEKVSELAKLPDFLPGLGTLYVDPKTLPVGPFLAHDHAGKLVSTILAGMIPLKDLDAQKAFADLAAPGGKTGHVSIYYAQHLLQCRPSRPARSPLPCGALARLEGPGGAGCQMTPKQGGAI